MSDIQRYSTFEIDGHRVFKRSDDGAFVFHSAHADDLAAMRARAEKAERALSDADIVIHSDGRVTAAFYVQGGKVIRMPLEEWKAARRNEAEKAGDQ